VPAAGTRPVGIAVVPRGTVVAFNDPHVGASIARRQCRVNSQAQPRMNTTG